MSELRSQYEASVNELHYHNGAFVREGDTVITLEVCKMLSPVAADVDGIITYYRNPGDYVTEGDLLVRID